MNCDTSAGHTEINIKQLYMKLTPIGQSSLVVTKQAQVMGTSNIPRYQVVPVDDRRDTSNIDCNLIEDIECSNQELNKS